MSNVYMSFLGTNDYLECLYYQNQNFHQCRFVQEATISFYCHDWTADDRIVIFTTKEADIRNWQDDGHKDYHTGQAKKIQGLKTRILQMNLQASVEQVIIPSGIDENDIWTLFNQIYDQLHEKDKVIFDITHAYRTIPLFAIVVLNYAKIMKEIQLQGIYYGALETLGSINDAKLKSPENRRVPIVDYTALDQLLEWTSAIDQYIKTGNANDIGKLTESQARSRLSKSKGKDRFLHSFRKLGESLQTFSMDMATVRGLSITSDIQRVKANINDCSDIDLVAPFKPVLSKIKARMESFQGNPSSDYSIDHGIQAAQFCLDHNMIQQALTLIVETMISYFLDRVGINPLDFSTKTTNSYRQLVNQAIAIYVKDNQSKEKWLQHSPQLQPMKQKLLLCLDNHQKIINQYHTINDYRNDINHAGINKDPKQAKVFKDKISNFLSILPGNIATIDTRLKS